MPPYYATFGPFGGFGRGKATDTAPRRLLLSAVFRLSPAIFRVLTSLIVISFLSNRVLDLCERVCPPPEEPNAVNLFLKYLIFYNFSERYISAVFSKAYAGFFSPYRVLYSNSSFKLRYELVRFCISETRARDYGNCPLYFSKLSRLTSLKNGFEFGGSVPF